MISRTLQRLQRYHGRSLKRPLLHAKAGRPRFTKGSLAPFHSSSILNVDNQTKTPTRIASELIRDRQPGKAISVIMEHIKQLETDSSQSQNVKLAKAHDILSLAYLRLNELDLALESINKSLNLAPRLDSHLIKSDILVRYGDRQSAIEELLEAAEFDTSSGVPHYQLSTYFYEIQDYEASLRHGEESHKRDPTLYSTIAHLSILYKKLGNEKESMKFFEEAMKLSSDDASIWSGHGMVELELGNESRAKEYFQRALRIDPKDTSGLFYTAYFLAADGESNEAKSILKELVDTLPPHDSSYLNSLIAYSIILSEGEEYKELERAAESIVEIDPASPYGYHYKALIAKHKALNAQAITYFQKAIELSPEFMISYDKLAFLLYTEGRLDDALDVCNKGLSVDNSYPDLIYMKTVVLIAKRGFSELSDFYGNTLKESDHPRVLLGFSLFLFHAGEHQKAAEVMKVVNMDHPDYHYLNGLIHLQNGNYSEAYNNFSNIREGEANFHLSRLKAAEACVNLKNYDKALEIYDNTIKESPELGMVYIHKARVLFEMGKYEEAMVQFEGAYLKDKLVANESIKGKIECLRKLGLEEEIPSLESALSDMDVNAPHNVEMRGKKSFDSKFKPLSEVVDEMEFR